VGLFYNAPEPTRGTTCSRHGTGSLGHPVNGSFIRYSTEYSSSKKLDSHTPTHKSTLGVNYRTGSPGQLGLRVAGFQGHWVAGSQNVIYFHVRPAAFRLSPYPQCNRRRWPSSGLAKFVSTGDNKKVKVAHTRLPSVGFRS